MKDIRQAWKAIAADRKITSTDIAALCIYRTLLKEQGVAEAVARLKKSFSPVSNSVKLANGAAPYYSLHLALKSIQFSVYKNSTLARWLPEEEYGRVQDLARQALKEIK